MRIRVLGAAGEVTGSCTLLETDRARVLIDCGLFQGRDGTEAKNRDLTGVEPERLDAVILTHAHLDHCGRLPLLVTNGFRGRIFCTPATADLVRLILLDSAHIQESDTARENRRRERRGKPPLVPLYDRADVERVLGRIAHLPYDQRGEVAEGVDARLVDAGHMLGSASIELQVSDRSLKRRLVFSGDLGVRGTPILKDPVPLSDADFVVLESTYGDRDHRPLDQTLTELGEILRDAIKGRERVLIPAFAIGRSQQMLYHIAELVRSHAIAPIPVYLDSPMAIEATRIYAQHVELFDDEASALARSHLLEASRTQLTFTETAEESKRLNNLREAAVIIASSGMCEGGRILHHLKHNLWRKYVHVVFVGYQAQGTLGERIVSGAKVVRVLGEPVVVGAEIHTLGGFSGHAGQTELLDWMDPLFARNRPRVVLNHGEQRQRGVLRDALRQRFQAEAHCPERFETIEID